MDAIRILHGTLGKLAGSRPTAAGQAGSSERRFCSAAAVIPALGNSAARVP